MFTKKRNTLDNVSIYIEDSNIENYYAESYFLYKNHLNYLLHKINSFTPYKSGGNRNKYFTLLYDAYHQNAKNVNNLTEILKEKVTINSYERLRINSNDNTQITLKDFVYLRRDWSFEKEAEEQIKTTLNSLKKELTKIKHDTNNSLFLGSGVGRLAFEFTDIYQKVYATDKSFSMIWHLQQLLDGQSITFYNPHEKNVHKIENVAKKYIAKIPEKKLNQGKNKFEAIVSDVLNLPFENNSINSIFSIYFTDVIALKLWFNEINNKLSEKGLFIHFGPLDYFFSDEREMLTAEEFKLFFESNGYTTLVDKVIETPHLQDSNSISYKVYRNWFYIAQKNPQKKFEINDDTILNIKIPISYERKGNIKEGIQETEVNLSLPNGVFSGAGSVIQILKFVNGKNSFKDILLLLENDGILVDNPNDIKSLLINFLKQGYLE